jgi:AGZA family xanthine/uracil permease-like MFS transporter
MTYILTVNSTQLEFDSSTTWSSIFLVTCFGSVVVCSVMAFHANAPYAQSHVMELNFRIGLLVRNDAVLYDLSFDYENKMTLDFIYTIIIFIVIVFPIGRDPKTNKCTTLREKVFDGIPDCVRDSTSDGI